VAQSCVSRLVDILPIISTSTCLGICKRKRLFFCDFLHNIFVSSIASYFFFTVRGSDGQYCFRPTFFAVRTITHEPLHLA